MMAWKVVVEEMTKLGMTQIVSSDVEFLCRCAEVGMMRVRGRGIETAHRLTTALRFTPGDLVPYLARDRESKRKRHVFCLPGHEPVGFTDAVPVGKRDYSQRKVKPVADEPVVESVASPQVVDDDLGPLRRHHQGVFPPDAPARTGHDRHSAFAHVSHGRMG